MSQQSDEPLPQPTHTGLDRSKLERRLNLAVQRNGNLTVLFTNAISQQVGLSATEFECFSLLLDNGPLTAGQLGQRCGLSSGGVTGLVNRLVKAGFVTRQQDPQDRRRVIISATPSPEAYQKIVALYGPVGQAFGGLFSQYDDQEIHIIANFLEQASDMAEVLLAQMRNQAES